MNGLRQLRVVFTSDRERPVRWEMAAMDAVSALDGVQVVGRFLSGKRSVIGGKGLQGAMLEKLRGRLWRRPAWHPTSEAHVFNDPPDLPPTCDVIIHFGAEDLPAPWTQAATQGIWGLRDPAGSPVDTGTAVIAAWVNRSRTLALTIRQQDGRGVCTLLERVYPLPASLVANALSELMMHASNAFARLCTELLQGQGPRPVLTEGSEPAAPSLLRSIGTWSMDLFPGLDRPRRTPALTWNIGVAEHPIERCLSAAPYNVRWMAPPGEGSSRLNPFGYLHEDRLNVLYAKEGEEGRSIIARLRPKPDQLLKRSRAMLSGVKDHEHAFIAMNDEGTFAVLGAPGNNGVVLYRVTEANDALEPVSTICDAPLHHATLCEHQGRWWLMGTMAPYVEAELHLFHAERITGPFRPHARDPVKVDVRSAKPAGTPFVHQGVLHRPAQDLSDPDRPQVVMTRIARLDPDAFEEEVVFHVPPAAGGIWSYATSTLSAVNGTLVIGGARRPAGMPAEERRHHRSFDDE